MESLIDYYLTDAEDSDSSSSSTIKDLHAGIAGKFYLHFQSNNMRAALSCGCLTELTESVADDSDDNVIYSGDMDDLNGLMYATLEKIIEKMTLSIDNEFLEDFFIYFRTFTSAEIVAFRFLDRFKSTLDLGKDEINRVIRIRTFVILRYWITNYWDIDFGGDARNEFRHRLKSIIQEIGSSDQISSRSDGKIIETLLRIISRLEMGLFLDDTVSSPMLTTKVPLSSEIMSKKCCRIEIPLLCSFKKMFRWTGGSNTVENPIMMESSKTLALHFTLIDWELFSRVHWTELLLDNYNRDNLTILIDRFNKITDWVLGMTLNECNSRVFEKFVRVAVACHDLGNYATLVAITAALQNPELQKMMSRIGRFEWHCLNQLSSLAHPDKNFKALRESINVKYFNRSNLPVIPFIGLYISDLTFNSEFVADSKKGKMQNVQQLRLTASIIKRFRMFQDQDCYVSSKLVRADVFKAVSAL